MIHTSTLFLLDAILISFNLDSFTPTCFFAIFFSHIEPVQQELSRQQMFYLLVSILHLRSEIWTGASSAGSESSKWVRLAVRTKWLVSSAVETNMLWQLQACESQWKPILLTWVEMCLILGTPCPSPLQPPVWKWHHSICWIQIILM